MPEWRCLTKFEAADEEQAGRVIAHIRKLARPASLT